MVREAFEDFCESLLGTSPSPEKIPLDVLDLISKITEEDRERMGRQNAADAIRRTIPKMGTNKAPGIETIAEF